MLGPLHPSCTAPSTYLFIYLMGDGIEDPEEHLVGGEGDDAGGDGAHEVGAEAAVERQHASLRPYRPRRRRQPSEDRRRRPRDLLPSPVPRQASPAQERCEALSSRRGSSAPRTA